MHIITPNIISEFSKLLKESETFDDMEIRIIEALINLRRKKKFKSSAGDIAFEANISVTNAYKYLYALQDKGLVESLNGGNGQSGKKVFWLAGSTNPFPRILSYMARNFLKKKDIFSKLELLYERLVPERDVWMNEKIYEHYENSFLSRAALLFDMSQKEILITTERFFDDFILLDALKRAAARGVHIRILVNVIDPRVSENLRKIDIELRVGYGWPYVILVDDSHGMSVESENKGVWFLNHKTEYKNKFEDFWKKADEI